MTNISRAAVARALDAIYAQIPDPGCIGECLDSCTVFPVTGVELRRISESCGVSLAGRKYRDGDDPCPALKNGRCTV